MINQEQSLFRRILPHVGAVLLFLVITFLYFSPVFEGKVLPQHDTHQFAGMSQELRNYYHNEGVSSAWTGSMFSGMPSYQIGVWGSNPNLIDYIEKPLRALGNTTAGPVFAGMLMAYILLCVTGIGAFSSSIHKSKDSNFVLTTGFNVMPAILGAIAYSFSSYNIIIIEAGHVTKAWAIAYMPLVIAGVMVMFRRKYLLGGILMALGLCLEIKSNHLQVTYYTGLLCFILYMGFVIKSGMDKEIKGLLKGTGVLAVAVIIAVLCNASNFYGNYEMAQESIRGKSELTQPTETQKQSSGLDKDYTFAWSYGKAETLSLLIPNIHGGESGGMLGTQSNVYKQLKTQGQQLPPNGIQMYTYWGDQPFTSGPVYFGAIICFLFVLGMIVIKSKLKWVLLAATVFFIFLSWGRNFEAFNDLFFYHFPFYSKFRAVSTALIIPALTMVIVAVWAIKEFLEGTADIKTRLKPLYIAGGITAGFCLFMWLLPDFFFNFTSDSDAQWKAQMPDWFYSALLQDRKELLTSDALRSFIFVALTVLLLWFSTKSKGENRMKVASIYVLIIAVLVTADLWTIDKRYLNDGMFKNKSTYLSESFPKSNADNVILQDKSPSYRVLNLNNPFNESNTSYYHKSIGGYHAAKLKRYQELIDYRLQHEIKSIAESFQSQDIDSITANFQNLKSLNMLNMKYIIFDPNQQPLVNPYAYGNAWFVNKYNFVNNADEEIQALNSLDPEAVAVIDKKFEAELSGFTIAPDSTATIVMTEYKPDRVSYKSNTKSEQLAVFSEVYYDKGWEAYIDGKLVPHIRADWTLRALRIPAGEHTVEFKFIPHGYNTSRTVSTASSAVLILLLLGGIVLSFMRKEKETEA